MAEFERRIGRGTLGNKAASGTVIIQELGVEHLRTGRPIVYTSADSVFQIAAHEDVDPGARAVPDVPDRLRAGRGRARHGARDRAAVRRRAGRLHAHGEPARLRDGAASRDAARPAERRRVAGRGHRQDRRPVRRARHYARRAHEERHGGHGPARARARRGRARADLREPRGLRHALRPPQRPGGLRREPGAVRRQARGAAAASGPARPARAHRRPRQRPDERQHRSLARVRAAARHRRRGGRGARPRRAADVRRPGPDAGRAVRRGAARPRHELSEGSAGLPGDAGYRHSGARTRTRRPASGPDRSRPMSTIREDLEARELAALAPEAAKSADTRGRLRPEPPIRSGRPSSAIATASSTARPSGA